MKVLVEFIDMHVEQRRIRQHFLDIDEAAAVLDPQAGTEILCDDRIRSLDAHALRGFFGVGGHEFADDKRQDGENETDTHQRPGDAGNGNAADAQNDQFRMPRQPPERVHGANQYRHRNHLVDVPRRAQQHE